MAEQHWNTQLHIYGSHRKVFYRIHFPGLSVPVYPEEKQISRTDLFCVEVNIPTLQCVGRSQIHSYLALGDPLGSYPESLTCAQPIITFWISALCLY